MKYGTLLGVAEALRYLSDLAAQRVAWHPVNGIPDGPNGILNLTEILEVVLGFPPVKDDPVRIASEIGCSDEWAQAFVEFRKELRGISDNQDNYKLSYDFIWIKLTSKAAELRSALLRELETSGRYDRYTER